MFVILLIVWDVFFDKVSGLDLGVNDYIIKFF